MCTAVGQPCHGTARLGPARHGLARLSTAGPATGRLGQAGAGTARPRRRGAIRHAAHVTHARCPQPRRQRSVATGVHAPGPAVPGMPHGARLIIHPLPVPVPIPVPRLPASSGSKSMAGQDRCHHAAATTIPIPSFHPCPCHVPVPATSSSLPSHRYGPSVPSPLPCPGCAGGAGSGSPCLARPPRGEPGDMEDSQGSRGVMLAAVGHGAGTSQAMQETPEGLTGDVTDRDPTGPWDGGTAPTPTCQPITVASGHPDAGPVLVAVTGL